MKLRDSRGLESVSKQQQQKNQKKKTRLAGLSLPASLKLNSQRQVRYTMELSPKRTPAALRKDALTTDPKMKDFEDLIPTLAILAGDLAQW